MTRPADEPPASSLPEPGGLWQSSKFTPADRPAADAKRTHGDNVRVALAFVRKHYNRPGVRCVEYPADRPAPQLPAELEE